MCLVVNKNTRIEIAKNNITVYKIMVKKSDNKWLTPYQCMEIVNPVKGMSIKAKGDISRTNNHIGNEHYHEIHGGMLHAVQTLYHAMLRRTEAEMFNLDTILIWEMTIPKGTEFIVGKYNEIAAKEMVFERVVPSEELS